MNELNNKRPTSRPVGGADMRRRSQSPEERAREARLRALQMGNAREGRTAPPSEYSQMPLRPMTAMPAEGRKSPQRPQARPQASQQRQPAQRQRPAAQGQKSPVQGQRPPVQGQRPPVQGQRPPVRGQRPPVQGQRPATQGQRPAAQGQKPPVKAQISPARPFANKRPPERKAPPTKKQNGGWIIPEGSPVYTAEGRMYEGQRPPRRRPPENGRDPQRRPAPQNQNQRGPRPPMQDGRPQGKAPPPPLKKKKIFNKERFLFLVKTFFVRLLVMLIVVSLLGLWWYRAEFYSETEPKKGKVSFVLDGVGSYEAKAAVAYRGEVLYCDFTEMAEWFGMVSVGSVNSMRFICTDGISDTSSGKGGEEYAIFTSGSTTVLINGVSVILEAPCRTVDSHIWIPLSFVENYVSGVVCDRGAKGTNIKLTPEGAEDKDDEEEIVINAAFKVKAQNGLASVKYPE